MYCCDLFGCTIKVTLDILYFFNVNVFIRQERISVSYENEVSIYPHTIPSVTLTPVPPEDVQQMLELHEHFESQTMERTMFMLNDKSGGTKKIHTPITVTFQLSEKDGIQDKAFFENIFRVNKWVCNRVNRLQVRRRNQMIHHMNLSQ